MGLLGAAAHARALALKSGVCRISFTMDIVVLLIFVAIAQRTQALGVNWGTQSSHRLVPSIVVKMLQDNNIDKVKLFDADENTLKALVNTNIQVMVAIPNNELEALQSKDAAKSWVENNVSKYTFSGGVDIRYVAVANEPFLSSYNGSFINLTFPALQNIQSALNDANLGDKVKATVPMNADVLDNSQVPSAGKFRDDIAGEMTKIVQLLHENNAPFTVNIYPFISLYLDANFPQEYAYFDGDYVGVTDGSRVYKNTFDASYDTLLAALGQLGYPDTPVIVGEVGWPTDGFLEANAANAARFNQGFLNHVAANAGTPARPNTAIDYYLFGLLDEDQKSIAPGNFERHWGIFRYDGVAKYPLNLPAPSPSNTLLPIKNATGVKYLQSRWCVLADTAALTGLDAPITYACQNSDCTALGYGCSCNPYLDARGNASYAFNMYFQAQGQGTGTCDFNGLASITYQDPSVGSCLFIVQLDPSSTFTPSSSSSALPHSWFLLLIIVFSAFLTIGL